MHFPLHWAGWRTHQPCVTDCFHGFTLQGITWSPGKTVTGYKWKVNKSLEEVSTLALMNTQHTSSLMLHEVWGKINNHQVKTNLQPPGLLDPQTHPLQASSGPWVSYPWLNMRLFRKCLYGSEPKQARFFWTQDGDFWLCYKISGFGKIVPPLVWTLLGAFPLPWQASIPSKHAGRQMVMVKVNSVPSLHWHCTQLVFGFSYFPQ